LIGVTGAHDRIVEVATHPDVGVASGLDDGGIALVTAGQVSLLARLLISSRRWRGSAAASAAAARLFGS
jgi:hypothetical protein